jgi:hypothetical protein
VALALGERGVERMRAILVEVLAGRRDPTNAARELWELDLEFPGRTPTAKARERARSALDLALEVLADLVRARNGMSSEALAHGDVAAALPRDALDAQIAGADRKLEALLVTRADIDKNLDPHALLERAVAELEPQRAGQR